MTKSDLIGKVNASFTIIAAKPAERFKDIDGQIVLGYHRLNGRFDGITAEYVTWKYNGQTKGYFSGVYTTDFCEAVTYFKVRN